LDTIWITFGRVSHFFDAIFGYAHRVFWIRFDWLLDMCFVVWDTLGYDHDAVLVVKNNANISTRCIFLDTGIQKQFKI